jgi:hypothetical protein
MTAAPTGTASATSELKETARERGRGNEAPEVPVGRVTISDRIAAFAMLDQMEDATQAQKCMRPEVHAPLLSGLFRERNCWDAANDRCDGSPEPLRRAQETQALGKEVAAGREGVEELGSRTRAKEPLALPAQGCSP